MEWVEADVQWRIRLSHVFLRTASNSGFNLFTKPGNKFKSSDCFCHVLSYHNLDPDIPRPEVHRLDIRGSLYIIHQDWFSSILKDSFSPLRYHGFPSIPTTRNTSQKQCAFPENSKFLILSYQDCHYSFTFSFLSHNTNYLKITQRSDSSNQAFPVQNQINHQRHFRHNFWALKEVCELQFSLDDCFSLFAAEDGLFIH